MCIRDSAIAFSKLLLKFSNVNAAALKYTTLKPRNSPADKPIKVVFENKFFRNKLKSLIDSIITPIVDTIIPVIPNLFNLSPIIKYSKIAT